MLENDMIYCKALLSRMIACETVNPDGHEAALAELLRAELSMLGLNARVQAVSPGRANVIAEAGEGARALLFNGHLDVVPAVGDWTSDPFVLTERDGRLYGRGAADMKGPIAAMIAALRRVLAEGTLPGRIKLAFTADEEVGTTGIRRFLNEDDDSYIGAVIGEPSEMQVAVAHKGLTRIRVTLRGRAAHASRPQAGVNAVDKAADALLRLRAVNAEMGKQTHPLLPPRTLTATMIAGGEKENIIPAGCSFVLDARTFPGDTYEDTAGQIARALDELKQSDPDFDYALERILCVRAGEQPASHPFTRVCLKARDEALRASSAPQRFEATCEQCFLLDAGIPTVVIGPGSIAQAHIVDEYVSLAQLEQGIAYYAHLMRSAAR